MIHTFKMYRSLVLVHSQSCTTITTVNFRTFSSPQKEILYLLTHITPFPPSSYPQATNLLSVYIDLLILDISYNWCDTVFGLLASFPQHNVFKFHTCCSTYQYVISFCCRIIYHTLFVHLSVDQHLVYFYFLVIMNNGSVDICVQVFV